MPISLTEVLAEYLSRVNLSDLPDIVVRRAKQAVLDTMGAMIVGSQTHAGQAMIIALQEIDQGSFASVYGTNIRFSTSKAALINGTTAHALEMDDFGGCGHTGAVVIPAVLASAELAGCSGRRVLEAVVAGYEAAYRIVESVGGYRAHNDLGWDSTGTCGSFGSAAGVSRVLGLSPSATADALGLAGSFTGGIWAFIVDGAMSKRVHPGKAAENGLIAAYLAKNGITGPHHVLEAEWGGFFNTYAHGKSNPETIINGLGKEFGILRSGIKPYAACRGTHFAIDGLFELMDAYRLSRKDVNRIVLRCPAQTITQLGKRDVVTTLDAQFSLPYVLAVALLFDRVGIDQFSPQMMADPLVRTTMDLIELECDPSMPSSEKPWVTVETVKGERYTTCVQFAKGAPEKPLTDLEIAEKFRGQVTGVLGPDRSNRLLAAIQCLDEANDIAAICRLASPATLE